MALLRNPLAYLLLGLNFGCCLCLCNPAHAQKAPASHSITSMNGKDDTRPADLAADTRLDRQISLHEIGIPLNSLLIKVNHDDLALAADRNCDTLKLHLNLLNRPVRQLMNSLAQLVPGAWYHAPDGKGYILRMSQSAVSRRQRWWNLFLGERQRLWEEIPRRALQTMQARPEIKGEVTSADGNHEGFKQQLLAGPTFFNLLSAPLQEKIAYSLNQTPYYQERGHIWQNGMDEGAVIVPLNALPPQAQEQLSARLRLYNSQTDTLDNSYVLFENVGSIISADVVNLNGDLLPAGFHIDVNFDAEKPAFRIDHEALPRRVKQMGRNAPSVWKELAAYQESRVWPNDLPSKTHLSYQNRAEALEWLADLAHLEFVADYYSLMGGTHPTTMPAQLRMGLKEELNLCAAELDLSWKQSGDIYLCRDNRWYRDDGLEVPAPLLRRWLVQNVREWAKASASKSPVSPEAKAALTRSMLDWQAEVVSTLTPWQIFNGLAYVTLPPENREQYAWGMDIRHIPSDAPQARTPYAPFRQQIEILVLHYRLMLFYASLNADQRTTLLKGELNFNTLTGDQEQQTLYLQPLLHVYKDRHERQMLLGLRPRKTAIGIVDSSDLHLAITTPITQKPATTTGAQ